MYRLLPFLLLAAAVVVGCRSDQRTDPAEAQEVLVETQRVLDAYHQAAAAGDGPAAVALVSPSTLALYDEILVLAVEAGEDRLLNDLPAGTAYLTVLTRAQMGDELLTVSTGQELFESLVELGAAGGEPETMEMVDVRGDEAFGYLRGKRLFRFVRIDGTWQFDLDHLAQVAFAELGPDADDPWARTLLFEQLALQHGSSWSELSRPLT